MSKEDLKEKLKQKLKTPIDFSKLTVPNKQPRYDEIFFKGVEMLDKEDIETNEKLFKRLNKVENELAQRESLSEANGSIADQLFALLNKKKIFEDELVSKWLELYTTYNYWKERDAT